MMPPSDQTGTLHFHSSTTAGSASWMSARTRASAWPRQPPSSAIRPSISRAGGSPPVGAPFFMRAVLLPCAVGVDERLAQRLGDGGVGELALQHVEALGEVPVLLQRVQPLVGQRQAEREGGVD